MGHPFGSRVAVRAAEARAGRGQKGERVAAVAAAAPVRGCRSVVGRNILSLEVARGREPTAKGRHAGELPVGSTEDAEEGTVETSRLPGRAG